MLDGLRDLFLRAIECKKCSEANHLVDLWNEEVESINKRFNLYYTGKREVEAPTADAEPVRHGHWYFTEYEYFTCSVCGKSYYNGCESSEEARSRLEDGDVFDFCPHCGAKMDEKRGTVPTRR